MRTLLTAIVASALCLGAGSEAGGLEIPLTYQSGLPSASVDKDQVPSGSGDFVTSSTRPPGNWKMPALATDRPQYGLIRLGDRTHLLVLDTVKPGEKELTRAWFDRNADGDLTNDTPIDGELQGDPNKSYSVMFPPQDLKVQVDGVMLPYRIRPWTYPSGRSPTGETLVSFPCTVDCRYTGSFSRKGKQHTLYLIDENGNGRFDEHATVTNRSLGSGLVQFLTQGDYLYLPGGEPGNPGGIHPLGDLLLIDDGVFEVKIDIPKGRMTLTEITTGLGTLTIPFRTERLSLMTPDRKRCVMVDRSAVNAVRLPAGKYQLVSYVASRQDPQGDSWWISAAGTLASPVVTVSEGAAATLPLGEPFSLMANIMDTQPQKKVAILGFAVEGQGRERIDDLSHFKGKATAIPLSATRPNRPKEPTYTIVKDDGEIVARGSFEYG